MLSGDDDGWAWLKDKARQQGAQPPGAGGAALKPLGAPPPLPGPSPAARTAAKNAAASSPPLAATAAPRLPPSALPPRNALPSEPGLARVRTPADLVALAQQAARAAALLEAATITVAKMACGSALHTVRSSVRIPWQGSGEEGAERGDGGCSSLPLRVVMALAHHLVGEGAERGAEVSGATSVGLAHLSKFARTRKPLCSVLTPLLMFLKSKNMAGSGKLEELLDQVHGLRIEREQLYAQIQADAAVKKAQEQRIHELEMAHKGATPGGPVADSHGGAGGGGGGACEARVRELQDICDSLRDQLEATEVNLAQERSRHQQEEEHFTRAKKVLAAEVQRLRQQLPQAS